MNKLVMAVALAASGFWHPSSATDLCVPAASGVPTDPGPPTWWLPPTATTPDGQTIDDPRWLGAAGHSFDYGGAAIPFQVRALASPGSGTTTANFYLSFVVAIDPNATVGHEMFVGIHRPGTHTAPDPNGYIIQFHVDPGAATTPTTPTFCAAPPCASGDWYAVWTDVGNTGTCTVGGTTAEQFTASATPIPWIANLPTTTGTGRYFKLAATASSQARWAVEVQVPQVALKSTLDAGVEPGATIWYEAAQHTDATGVELSAVGQWPDTTSPNSICERINATPHALYHVDLLAATSYGNLTALTSGPAPSDCDTGLAIHTADIGAVQNAAADTSFATVGLDTEIHGTGVNTMIAQVENTSSAMIATPLMGRFRLASWGAAGLGTPSKWKDIRGAVGGICSAPAAGAAPCKLDGVPAGGRTSIHFNWTLGNDATLGNSEFCQYGLTPPNDTCPPCDCTQATSKCDATTDTGIQATNSTTHATDGACVSSYYQHECMEVELSVPNGADDVCTQPSPPAGCGATCNAATPCSTGLYCSAAGTCSSTLTNPVNFTAQSSWNNMNFAQLSITERIARIDVRDLPKQPGQKKQDVYLFVMPRNMPAAAPAGTTGISLVTAAALAQARAIAQTYSAAALPKEAGAALERIEALRKDMPPGDGARIAALLALAHATGTASDATHQAVTTLGPVEASNVVPTLEIYAYYKSAPQTWSPMTSFAVFLSHEGALGGIHYEIDGATKVAENIYHLEVPVDHAREIRIRSQALAAGESVEPPGNPTWPCRGGCCSGRDAKCGIVADLGNTGPALLVGMVFAGRRRKRPTRRAPR